jgi:hypothetical protein
VAGAWLARVLERDRPLRSRRSTHQPRQAAAPGAD